MNAKNKIIYTYNGKKRNKGFTLLEILIALTILMIGVASVVNMFPIGLHASKRLADFSSAGILAQEKIAELMYLGYDNVNQIHSGIAGIPGDMGTGITEPFPSPDDQYRWHLDLANTAITNLAKATLWIYWNDRGEQTDEKFITYIAKYD